MITSGVHAGMLYEANPSNKIYFIDDRGNASPIKNPQFKESIEKANKIFVIENSASSRIVFSKEISLFDKKISEKLNKTEVEKFIKNASRFIQKNNIKTNLIDFNGVISEPTRLLMHIVHWVLFPYNKLDELLQVKECDCEKFVSMLSEEQVQEVMNFVFDFMEEVPSIVKEVFCNDEFYETILESEQVFAKFWDRGESCLNESFASVLKLERGKEVIRECSGEISNLFMKISKEHILFIESFFSNFEKLIKTNFDSLFVVPLYFLPRFKNNNIIDINSPIKKLIYPRGFIWEIKKENKIFGYLLGSIHCAPKELQNQFLDKTFEFLQSSNVMAVEVDISNVESKRDGLKLLVERYDSEQVHLILSYLNQYFEKKNNMRGSFSDLVEALIFFDQIIEDKIGSGLDHAFIEKAKELNMEIKNLESIKMHAEYEIESNEKLKINDSNQKVEENFDVERFLKRHKSRVKMTAKNFVDEIFYSGLTEKLDMLFENQSQKEKESLNFRNMEMAVNIQRLILQGKKPFSVVGCLHFSGPSSIQKLLGQMGYKIEQIIID